MNNSELKFARGNSEIYLANLEHYKNYIFFGTDNHSIYMNGSDYGGNIKSFIKDIDMKLSTGDGQYEMVITYVDNSETYKKYFNFKEIVTDIVKSDIVEEFNERLNNVEMQLK